MNKTIIFSLIALLIIGAAIYFFAFRDANYGNIVLPDAVRAAEIKASLESGVDLVYVKDFEEKEWPNGCLGLAEEGEMCTEAIVSGYLVVVSANDKELVYRTNKDGSVIRREK